MILSFADEKGPMHFEFVFQGFILGGAISANKNLSILRRELGLLDKLEAISKEKPCGKKLPTDEPDRMLNKSTKKEELKIHIDSPEFDLLYNYVTTVPWQTGKPLRNALETIDWLERSQKMSA